MIQELLFTSYEGRGLNNAGGGFCTVLSTQGMAVNLASALEKLSGYRHPFDLHDPRSHHNPVNFRLAVLTIGGTKYRVLSRIADLRHEHTGRSNKLAHHVAFADRQDPLPVGGPTIVLRSGVCRDSWDRAVRQEQAIPPSALPQYDLPPGPCEAWKRVARDAGWAGVVGEALLAERDAVYHVIYPLQADVLALVEDVFRLIPPRKRWDLTFSTYYTSALPGSSCQLRFLLDGTPEAEHLRRDYRQAKIDLCDPSLGAPPDSPLVAAARSGAVRHAEPDAPARDAGAAGHVAGRSAAAALAGDDDRFAFDPVAMAPYSGSARSRHAAGDDDIRLGPPIARARGDELEAGARLRGSRGDRTDATNYTKIALVVVAALFLLAFFASVGAGGIALVYAWNSAEEEKKEIEPAPPQGEASGAKQPSSAAGGAGKTSASGSLEGGHTVSVQDSQKSNDKSEEGAKDGEPAAAESAASTDAAGTATSTGPTAATEDPPPSPTDTFVPPPPTPQETAPPAEPSATPVAPAEEMDPPPAEPQAPPKPKVKRLENELPWLTKASSGDGAVIPPVVIASGVGSELKSVELIAAEDIAFRDPAKSNGRLVGRNKGFELQWSIEKIASPKEEFSPAVAGIAIENDKLLFAWKASELEHVATNMFRLPLANSLRCCLAKVTTDAGEFYIPLMRSLPPYKVRLIPVSSQAVATPDLKREFVLPKKSRLVFQALRFDAPDDLSLKGVEIAPIPTGDLTGGYDWGMRVVHPTKDGPITFLESKLRVTQGSELNRLELQPKVAVNLRWVGGDLAISEDVELGDAVEELEAIHRALQARKSWMTGKKEDAPADQPANTDPASVLTKKAWQAEIDKVQRWQDVATLQKDIVGLIKDEPISVELAVGAKYGDEVPIVWIYGEPKEEAQP